MISRWLARCAGQGRARWISQHKFFFTVITCWLFSLGCACGRRLEEGAGGEGGILNIFAIPFRHISSPYQLCDTENICYSIIDKLKKLWYIQFRSLSGATGAQISHKVNSSFLANIHMASSSIYIYFLFYLFPFSDVKVEHREKNIFYYFHERVLCQVINFPTRFIWCDRSYKYRKNQLKKCFWYDFPSRSHMMNYALLVLKYPNWHRLSPPIVFSKPKNVTCPLI